MRRGIDKGLLKEMIGFAGWNFITSFSSIFTQYGLGIVLNYFYGALLNAAQGIANQLSGMLMAFSNSMLKAVNPVITKSEGHGDRMKALQYAMKGSKFSFVFLSFFAIPFITEMNSILVIWLNKVPEWAVLFCSLQLLRTLIEQLTVGLLSMLKAYGDIKLLSIMRGMLNIMPMIATVLAFVNGCAPYWMYIFWIFFWSLGGCMVILFLSKKLLGLHLKVYLNEVILPCLAIAIIPFIVIIFIHMIQISSMMKMCLILLLYMFSFFLLLRLLVLSKDERLFLYNRFCNIRASINESIH